MDVISNPFRPTKFEYHGRPLIWLSHRASLIEQPGSFYLSGTRGSGKTSLLRALNWWERINNRALREQISSNSPLFIGIYFRVPDYLSSSLATVPWKDIYTSAVDIEDIDFGYFSLFIECVSLKLICDAISQQRSENIIRYDAQQETEIIRAIYQECPSLEEFRTTENEEKYTFVGLSTSFRNIYQDMYSAARRGQVRHICNSIPQDVPGRILNEVSTKLVNFLESLNDSSDKKRGYIKICIDDCELLTIHQQKYLNTLVRTSKFPIFWVISYVGRNYQATLTRLEAQPLAETDRRIVNLEPETNSEKKEFLKLCQAVSCLRIHYAGADSRKSLSDVEDLKEIFDFGTILGPTNVNQLLHYTAKRKLRKDWRALAARAHEMRARFAPRINENQVLEEEDAVDETPLYYQAYLADRLGKEDAFLEMEQSSKERFSAYLRRKQRAALLYICAQFGIARIPYGGWHAVVSMSDGCIRDFLEIMAEIFEEFQTTRSDKINAFSRAMFDSMSNERPSEGQVIINFGELRKIWKVTLLRGRCW